MYTCAYPIYASITVPASGYADYTITLSGNTIYTGRIYSSGNTSSIERVDISPVCREFLDTNFETFPLLQGTSNTSVGVFTVGGAGSGTFEVCYNYNTDYVLELATGSNLNSPITDKVDTRQLVGTSILSSSGITVTHSNPVGEEGSIVTIGGFDYTIVSPCPNRYAIYYVNKDGGIDYLICTGYVTDRITTSRTDGNLYSDRTDRRVFGNTRVNQFVTKQYECNTGWLPSDRAQNIDHLIFSPKVWIHSLEDDTITACLVDTSSISKQRRTRESRSNLINYSFTVSESKQYYRK